MASGTRLGEYITGTEAGSTLVYINFISLFSPLFLSPFCLIFYIVIKHVRPRSTGLIH